MGNDNKVKSGDPGGHAEHRGWVLSRQITMWLMCSADLGRNSCQVTIGSVILCCPVTQNPASILQPISKTKKSSTAFSMEEGT